MRIVCPSCDAAYDVPAGVVAACRTVRCARCGADFVAIASLEPGAPAVPEATQAAAFIPAPAPSPSPELRVQEAERLVPPPPHALRPQPRVFRGRTTAVLAAWALSLGVLAAGGWAGMTWRDRIMQVWPPSTRLYAALGYRN